jgi:hypothetical protein
MTLTKFIQKRPTKRPTYCSKKHRSRDTNLKNKLGHNTRAQQHGLEKTRPLQNIQLQMAHETDPNQSTKPTVRPTSNPDLFFSKTSSARHKHLQKTIPEVGYDRPPRPKYSSQKMASTSSRIPVLPF